MMPTFSNSAHAEEAGIQAESFITAEQNEYSDYPSENDASDTFSVASSINEYVMENGRRYHTYWGPNKNPMPCDDIEQHRLDLAHECTLQIRGGKLYDALIGNQTHRVLDLGTGTGAWAVDFAQANPQAEVVGIDISPNMPTWVPPNCRFELDDFEADWNYQSPFDFIHARTLMQSVNDWPSLLHQIKKHLRPGAWVELGEYYIYPECDDNTIPPNWPPVVLCDLFMEALAKTGRKCPRGNELAAMLQEAGFVDVCVKSFKLPLGPWAKNPVLKRAGAMCMHTTETGYEAYTLQLLTKVLGIPEEDARGYCERAKAAHTAPGALKIHAYISYYAAYGRKPHDG